MRSSESRKRKSRLDLLQDEKRRLSRHTPQVTSDKQAMKIIGIETRYYYQNPSIRRPQVIEELFNDAFKFYKYRRMVLENKGEECRESLVKKMTSKHLKKFNGADRIASKYGISTSGSKSLQPGVDEEIHRRLKAYIYEDLSRSGWRSEEWQRDLHIDILSAIEKLISIDRFILDLYLASVSKTEIIWILESNDVANARGLIGNAFKNLRKQLKNMITSETVWDKKLTQEITLGGMNP